MQSDALQLVKEIEAIEDDGSLERFFIDREFTGRTICWDPLGLFRIPGLVTACFDAAIDRRNLRDGFRRDSRGARQRRIATGYEYY